MKLQASHYWAAGSVAFSAAFLLCGYEFIRSSSNTLYKAAYGKEKLPVVMALMPLGVLAVLAIYGRVLSWLGARRTLFWSTLACGAVLAGCTTLVRGGWTVFTGALYIFREAYVVLLIEQYWSFLNSSLGEKEARKLNGPVTGIASVGGILGGLLVQALAERLGTSAMPFFAAVSLLPAAFLSDLGYARAGEPRPSSEEAGGARGHLGLKSLRASPVLGLLLTVIVSTQVVSTCLDLRFQGMLQDRIPEADRQTAFSGGFYAALNAAAAFLQFVAAPLVLSTVPLWTVLVGIPLIHLAACAALAISPSLATAGAAYLLFKCLDYSLFRAAKEILYIPLPFDARYRAKEFIDVFGYRFSKGGSSLAFVLLQKAGVALDSLYALVALGASAAWLGLAVPLVSRCRSAPALPDSSSSRLHGSKP